VVQTRLEKLLKTARPSGRIRLLDAAIEVIEEQGASAVRVSDLVDRADVSLGLIAHHFGSRDGLIAMAQTHVFEESVEQDVRLIEQTVELHPTQEQLVDGLRGWVEQLLDPGREAARFQRIAALGAAHGEPNGAREGVARHPSARELLAESTGVILDRIESIITALQERDQVRRDVDARALAAFLKAFSLGAIVTDLDPKAPSRKQLCNVVDTVLATLLVSQRSEAVVD
jgi:AcrR family transcriptional regulator